MAALGTEKAIRELRAEASACVADRLVGAGRLEEARAIWAGIQRQEKSKIICEDYARLFGCQFIISTHSPFLLSLRGQKYITSTKTPLL